MTTLRHQRIRRVLLLCLMIMAPLWPLSSRATAPALGSAHVVSTPELAVRSCPDATCPAIAVAPLGADIAVTGEEVDGFVPVAFEGASGYVSPFFVANDPGDPPFFAFGSPGCQRVAFLFNVGVGFPPAGGILDTLQAEDVPAAMFVMGWWVDQQPPPPVLARMVNAGYLIGSHGYEAVELTTRSDDDIIDDVTHAASAITQATGRPPAPYFTPYAAAIDDRVRSLVATQGLLPIAWEVPAADYGADVTADAVYDRVMDAMYDGAIVEFHLDAEASAASTGQALPRIIADLRQQGYQFVSIPDLLQPCGVSGS